MGTARTTSVLGLALLAWIMAGTRVAHAKDLPSAYGSFGTGAGSGAGSDRDADEEAPSSKPKPRTSFKARAPVRQPRKAIKTSIDGSLGHRDSRVEDDDDGL